MADPDLNIERITKALNELIGIRRKQGPVSWDEQQRALVQAATTAIQGAFDIEPEAVEDVSVLDRPFTDADAKQVVQDVFNAVRAELRRVGHEITTDEVERIWRFIQDNLFSSESAAIPSLSRLPQNLASLPFVEATTMQVLGRQEADIRALPSFPTEGMRIGQVLNGLRRNDILTADEFRQLTVNRTPEGAAFLERLQARMPDITQAAVQAGSYRQVIEQETEDDRLQGRSLFPMFSDDPRELAIQRHKLALDSFRQDAIENPEAALRTFLSQAPGLPTEASQLQTKEERDYFNSVFSAYKNAAESLQFSGLTDEQRSDAILDLMRQASQRIESGLREVRETSSRQETEERETRLRQEAAEALQPFNRVDSTQTQVQDFLDSMGVELPPDIVTDLARSVMGDVWDAKNQGEPPNIGSIFQNRILDELPKLLSMADVQTSTASNQALSSRIFEVLANLGQIGPASSPEFLKNITQVVVPRIASAIKFQVINDPQQLAGLGFEEYINNLLPQTQVAEDAPLQPPFRLPTVLVNESDFVRQMGGPGGRPPSLPGLPSFTLQQVPDLTPFTDIAPVLREASGQNLPLLNFLTGLVPEMQQEFQEAQVGQQPDEENMRRIFESFRSQFEESKKQGFRSQFEETIREGRPAQPGRRDAAETLEMASRRQQALSFAADPERLMGVARRLSTPEPLEFGKFFSGRFPDLMERFRQSPAGLQQELRQESDAESAQLRAERDTEQQRLTAERSRLEAERSQREAETTRRRQLRSRGTTTFVRSRR